jgi:hypothetical protein
MRGNFLAKLLNSILASSNGCELGGHEVDVITKL